MPKKSKEDHVLGIFADDFENDVSDDDDFNNNNNNDDYDEYDSEVDMPRKYRNKKFKKHKKRGNDMDDAPMLFVPSASTSEQRDQHVDEKLIDSEDDDNVEDAFDKELSTVKHQHSMPTKSNDFFRSYLQSEGTNGDSSHSKDISSTNITPGSTESSSISPAPKLPSVSLKELGSWEKHTKGIGSKLLQKFGFKGRLGANETGVSKSIEVVVRPTGVGLGFGDVLEQSNLLTNKIIEAEWRGKPLPEDILKTKDATSSLSSSSEQKKRKQSEIELLASSKSWKKNKKKESNNGYMEMMKQVSQYALKTEHDRQLQLQEEEDDDEEEVELVEKGEGKSGVKSGEDVTQTRKKDIIIDMRYQDVRVLTDYTHINQSIRTNKSKKMHALSQDIDISSTSELNKPLLGEELLYNMNLVCDMIEIDVNKTIQLYNGQDYNTYMKEHDTNHDDIMKKFITSSSATSGGILQKLATIEKEIQLLQNQNKKNIPRMEKLQMLLQVLDKVDKKLSEYCTVLMKSNKDKHYIGENTKKRVNNNNNDDDDDNDGDKMDVEESHTYTSDDNMRFMDLTKDEDKSVHNHIDNNNNNNENFNTNDTHNDSVDETTKTKKKFITASVSVSYNSSTENLSITMTDQVSILVTLYESFSEEFLLFNMIHLFPTLIQPLFQYELSNWISTGYEAQVLQSWMKEWYNIYDYFEDRKETSVSNQIKLYMEELSTCYIVPHIRRFILNEWKDIYQPTHLISLFKILKYLLSQSALQALIDTTLFPKLQSGVNQWVPGRKSLPIHTMLIPWIPILGDKCNSFYPDIRRKMNSYLHTWDGRDSSVYDMIVPWMSIFDSTSMNNLLIRGIIPKLSQLLQQMDINPINQDITTIEILQKWYPILPTIHYIALFVGDFFPRWLHILAYWLCSATTVNYEEIKVWYSGWKHLLTHLKTEDKIPTILKTDSTELDNKSSNVLLEYYFLPLFQAAITMMEYVKQHPSQFQHHGNTDNPSGDSQNNKVDHLLEVVGFTHNDKICYKYIIDCYNIDMKIQERLHELSQPKSNFLRHDMFTSTGSSTRYAADITQSRTLLGKSQRNVTGGVMSVSFKEVVEAYALQHNIEFYPRPGLEYLLDEYIQSNKHKTLSSSTSRQMYQFGPFLCYLDQNVMYVQSAVYISREQKKKMSDETWRRAQREWVPIDLEELISLIPSSS